MTASSFDVIIIGGGAAGFFSAINVAITRPGAKILILEKTQKLLSKVSVSGGGRCNVTHHCFDKQEMIKNYPRGSRELLQVFSAFGVEETIAWFHEKGVKLKSESDGRMFPITDSSQTIIDCFLELAKKYKIGIETGTEVHSINKHPEHFLVKTSKGNLETKNIICASGGYPKSGAYSYIAACGHTIIEPIPSLFTFNLPDEPVKKLLQGVSVKNATVSIEGIKLKSNGPLLITHWGLSGPAVLKFSAFAAEDLNKKDYSGKVKVNWTGESNKQDVFLLLKKIQSEKPRTIPHNSLSFEIPKRLWEYLCDKSDLVREKPWAEISDKKIMAFATILSEDIYDMRGKTTFKEEFVTCGGVNRKEINFKTMESRVVPGLYFCGEVIDIDGITGGFNFQSAWSTAWVAARSVANT